MPYPWLPPRGKPEKKAVFSPYCGDETTTNYNRAFFKGKKYEGREERPRERSPSPRQESGLKGALLGKCPPQRPPFQGSSAGRRCLARSISASAATRRRCGSEICCPYGAPQGAVNRARRSLGRYGARGRPPMVDKRADVPTVMAPKNGRGHIQEPPG